MSFARGYAFVPLPDGVERRPRNELTLDRRLDGHVFGELRFTYSVDQPLHVGSGIKDVRDRIIVRQFARDGEDPIIPGSSFKGALRSRFEAMSHSCVTFGEPNLGRDLRLSRELGSHPCLSPCKKI